MWLDNLKELKKKTGMSAKQISEKTNLPERTVSRILAGETDHPYADTLDLIVKALGYDLGDIFADTKVIVATDELVDIKETVDVVEAERDLIIVENEMLKARMQLWQPRSSFSKRSFSTKKNFSLFIITIISLNRIVKIGLKMKRSKLCHLKCFIQCL